MKDIDKVTLTVAQLKKLVTEAKAKKQKVNEDEEYDRHKEWIRADRKLGPTKREIAQKAKELYKQLVTKFVNTMSKDFIRNNISFHSDRPQDAAEQVLEALMDGESLTTIVHEMYLFSND